MKKIIALIALIVPIALIGADVREFSPQYTNSWRSGGSQNSRALEAKIHIRNFGGNSRSYLWVFDSYLNSSPSTNGLSNHICEDDYSLDLLKYFVTTNRVFTWTNGTVVYTNLNSTRRFYLRSYNKNDTWFTNLMFAQNYTCDILTNQIWSLHTSLSDATNKVNPVQPLARYGNLYSMSWPETPPEEITEGSTLNIKWPQSGRYFEAGAYFIISSSDSICIPSTNVATFEILYRTQ